MLKLWRRRRQNRTIVDALYERVVERARRPSLYLQGGLPDTVMGRYEAMGIEVFLVLTRCRGEPRLAALSQDLVDRFMLDIDHSIRELGVGYLAVPKRMRKLAARFYARIAAFRTPLLEGDEAALALAVSHASHADLGVDDEDAAAWLAHYMLEEHQRLAAVATDEILGGRLSQPA